MTARTGKRRAAVLLALEGGPRSTSSLVKELNLKWGAVTGVLESPSVQGLVEQDAERRWCLGRSPAVTEALAEARAVLEAERDPD